MFLNIQVIISFVFKRENGVGGGKARKARLWGGSSGPEQGNLEAQHLFWWVSWTSLFSSWGCDLLMVRCRHWKDHGHYHCLHPRCVVAENLLGTAISLLHFTYSVGTLLTAKSQGKKERLEEVKAPACSHPGSKSTLGIWTQYTLVDLALGGLLFSPCHVPPSPLMPIVL